MPHDCRTASKHVDHNPNAVGFVRPSHIVTLTDDHGHRHEGRGWTEKDATDRANDRLAEHNSKHK